MALFAVVVLLGLVVVVPALVAGVVLAVAGRRELDAVDAARRHDALITLATVLAALLTALGVLTLPVTWTSSFLPTPAAPGMLLAAGPFAVAVVACLVRLAGELTWPRPRGAVRTAPLARRTVHGLGGWRLGTLVATSVLLTVVLVLTGLTASDDGGSITAPLQHVPGGGTVSSSAGPYPGWPYAAPMLLGLGAALACVVVTLGVVARRAPLDGLGLAEDDALRRTSAARLLGVAQLCVGGATALVLAVAGQAARNAGAPRLTDDGVELTVTSPGLVGAGTAALVLALVVGVASVVVSAVGARRRRTPAGRASAPGASTAPDPSPHPTDAR